MTAGDRTCGTTAEATTTEVAVTHASARSAGTFLIAWSRTGPIVCALSLRCRICGVLYSVYVTSVVALSCDNPDEFGETWIRNLDCLCCCRLVQP